MKLINHKDSGSYDVDTYVMRGIIEMTTKEYKNCLDYLKKEDQKAVKKIDTYTRDSLSFMQHYSGKVYETPKSIISVGVHATSLIAKKYGLKNYKDINYGIKIVK